MNYIDDLIKRYPSLMTCKQTIEDSFFILSDSLKKDGKLLIAGNGGSAADSDHIAGELLKSFVKKRKLPNSFKTEIINTDKIMGKYLADKLQGSLPAVVLANNSSVMTASLNDVDGNIMFAQQIVGLGEPGDVFLGISTSGNSKNIIYAMITAKAKGLKTIALTGRDGGRIRDFADISIIVPETETYKIQELHLPIYHALCLELEDFFWKE